MQAIAAFCLLLVPAQATAQLEDAPLIPGFDVVCAWDTVEHVPDPLSFWRTVRSQVADDGVVLFSTPYVSSLPARLLGTRWWTLKPTEHIWHFTPRTHALLLARAGLALTRVVRNPCRRRHRSPIRSRHRRSAPRPRRPSSPPTIARAAPAGSR